MIQNLGQGWVRFVFENAVDSRVYLVGDFNEWNEAAHLMELQDNGTHQAILRLSPGEYEFKYKSGNSWFNDTSADKYVQNCWGSENSVAVVPTVARRDHVEFVRSAHRPDVTAVEGPAFPIQPSA